MAALAGFVYAPFRTGDLLGNLVPDEIARDIDLRINDGSRRSGETLFYDSNPNASPATPSVAPRTAAA